MRLHLALLISIACSACFGEDREPTPCGPFADRYELRWDERAGGTCGDLPTVEVTRDELTGIGPTCTGSTHVSEDGCDIILDEQCPDETGEQILVGTGTLSQVAGPSRVEGVAYLQLQNAATGEPVCDSTYDVTAVAL